MLDQAHFHDSDSSLTAPVVYSSSESLSASKCLDIYQLMVRGRVMEEQMVRMTKSGESYFWIGGPGEEALGIALGLQVKKGCGPEFDYLHLHYRSSATMLAMGMPMIDAFRQAAMRRTDRNSMGRNFIGHFARREWNVLPVTSVIEIQYAMASGTALMQKRCEGEGVTIVTGGDAGTAEGDFASCLIWSSRPGNEVPVLMIVANNQWGISTPAATQHSEHNIADRAEPFGIPADVVDGNDPIACWHAIRRGLQYCRRRRRPYLLEVKVSRLYGHSSASGAKRVNDEPDCLQSFKKQLQHAGILDEATAVGIHRLATEEADAAAEQVRREPHPRPEDLQTHTYASSRVDSVYPTDFTGLPA